MPRRFGLMGSGAVLAGVMSLWLAGAPPAAAATITVTSTAGTRDDPGGCTLRDAITAANTDTATGGCPAGSGADTLILTAAPYTFTAPDNWWYGPNALPAISSPITLEGNGAVIERSSAAGTAPFRLFYVSGTLTPGMPQGTLALRKLTLRNGNAKGGNALVGGGGLGAGGAIFNQGDLTLEGVTLTTNRAEGGSISAIGPIPHGGGIAQDAQTTSGGGFGGVFSCATFPCGGGGSDGVRDGGGGGGGFAVNGGDATIASGGVGGGFSRLGGGGGGAGGGVGGDGGGGGAGFGAGFGDGGGGFGGGGGGFGGGVGGGFGGGGAGLGGAVFSMYGQVSATNSTVTANTAVGGTADFSGLGGGGGSGYGGGLFNLNGTVVLTNVTFAANTVQGGTGFTKGVADGGAVYHLAYANWPDGSAVTAQLTLTNSILTGSTDGTDPVDDLVTHLDQTRNNPGQTNSAGITFVMNGSAGTNLVQGATEIGSPTTTGAPLTSTDPQLGSLADNGGPTQTMALSVGSPAIDAGTNTGCPTTDQRGRSRPAGAACDLGAYEFGARLATTTQLVAVPSPAVYGAPVTLTATVSPTAATGTVSFWDGATLLSCAAGNPRALSSGQAACTLTAPAAGTYPTLTARYSGDATYDPSQGTTSLTVERAAQSINFPPLADRTWGDPPVALTATATSGLPVSFTASGPCTISGPAQVTLTGAGTCTVTATQDGSQNYQPASPVLQSFTIAHAVATLSLTATPAAPTVNQPTTLTARVSSSAGTPGGSVVISGGGQQCTAPLSGGSGSCALTFRTAGAVTLTATYNGAQDWLSVSANLDLRVRVGIASAATPVPTLSDWAMLLLGALMLGIVWQTKARERTS